MTPADDKVTVKKADVDPKMAAPQAKTNPDVDPKIAAPQGLDES